jgi:hypothetical protein
MRNLYLETKFSGEVAQSVERETENLCVGGSIPSLAIPQFPPYGAPKALFRRWRKIFFNLPVT